MIRRLLANGYRITVVAPVDEYIRYREDFPELDHVGLHQLDRDSTNPWQDFRLWDELRHIYRRIKPDVVLHYTVKANIYGGLAAGVLGIPSIAVVTGLGYPFIHNGLIRKVTRNLYRMSNRFHEKVVFENNDDLKLFVESDLIDGDKGIAILGCGVDTTYYEPRAKTNQQDKVIFTFVGRLLYDKGVREFVHAAKTVRSQLPNTEFWLLGELDTENPSSVKEKDLIEWVKDPNIYYLGSKKDVRSTLANSDCIVLPSYREGFSRVLMEAMSMSRPVITTRTPGCSEAVDENQTGFLVPVGDAQALAKTFIQFLDMSSEERTEMGEKAREKAMRDFDDKVVADRIADVVESVWLAG